MARMTRPTFLVWQKTPDTADEFPTVVEVEWADQVEAEKRARSYGITSETPQALTALWAWAAMARQGLTDLKYREWTDTTLVGLEKAPAVEAEDVDPTRAAPTALP